jgi:sugar-specific transcriptional regulator TrmB
MIDKILKSLELNSESIDLYKRLLEGGGTSAGQLARLTGMARATVYDLLGRLVEKGLVRQTQHRGVKNYAAEPVRKISTLFDQKIKQLNQTKKDFDTILPALEDKIAKHFTPPHFQLFEGPEAIKNILNDILLYRDLNTRSFWPISTSIETLSGAFFQQHNKQRVENNISVKAIWPQQRVVSAKEYPFLGSGKEHLRQIRIAPLDIDFEMGYWIYGTKIAFLSSQKESIGFIIESREMVEMMSVQHDIIWRLSTPIEKFGK